MLCEGLPTSQQKYKSHLIIIILHRSQETSESGFIDYVKGYARERGGNVILALIVIDSYIHLIFSSSNPQ